MSSSIKAIWRPLDLARFSSLNSLLSRSSHSLAILNDTAYLFGGELKPRTPIGSELIKVPLDGSSDPEIVISSGKSGSWPCARVGATFVRNGEHLYLWGGRGGKEMKPLDSSSEDLWKFDSKRQEWEMLATSGERPEDRSFHTMTSDEENLYLHAGCPTSGRLSTLHSLNLSTLTWKSLPSAPDPARGGTVLCKTPDSKLIRWGGFCGEELAGPLDVYDPSTQKWQSFKAEIESGHQSGDVEPPKRSVHILAPFSVKGNKQPVLEIGGEKKEVVAVLGMGEGTGAAKELGHDGAGKFLSDFYLLLQVSSNSSYSWLPIQTKSSVDQEPEPRGWLAFDVRPVSEKACQIVIQGGLNEGNKRLKDGWVLDLELP